jgi:Ca2+-binding RTX toxin-like protein
MAITASFLPGAGVLTEFGDALNNNITTSRNAAGNLLINGGAVAIQGGTATVANTAQIQVFGLGGNDTLTLDETNGALPRAQIFGGEGNDVVTGGSGADLLFGQGGNDTLNGRGGTDFLFGGAGNDVLTGGDGDDQAFGESGNDRFIWNPGDDTDLFEGGDGTDTAEVNGGNGAEVFTITANGSRVRFDRVNPAPFSLDLGTTENLVLNANGGDDTITASNGLGTLIQLTLDGGSGNDSIGGGDGADNLFGGDGNDTVDGNRGDDRAFLGTGDDVFVWDPGDGSDVVEGQDGVDTMLFNGANIAETIDISANGGRARFTRDVANIVMDLNDVERITFNALGGADNINVHDLSGTDVTNVDINLAANGGGGDGSVDTITINATAGDDVVQVVGDNGTVQIFGLSAVVTIFGFEATDRLVINGLGGDDVINASTLAAASILLTGNGGDGDDILLGGIGNDTLNGNAGDDVLIGGPGTDVLDGGTGNNTVIQ